MTEKVNKTESEKKFHLILLSLLGPLILDFGSCFIDIIDVLKADLLNELYLSGLFAQLNLLNMQLIISPEMLPKELKKICKLIHSNKNITAKIITEGSIKVFYQAFHGLLMYVHTYDPLEIGDAARGRLQKGLLTGLDTLTNGLEPEISCTDDNWIVFNTDLGVKNVGIIYKWNYKFLFEFSGLIWCCIDKIDLDLEVQNTMIDGCVIFKLTKLILTRLDDLKFRLTGLGVLDKLVASIINLLCRIWREDIKAKIESQLKVLLNSQLDEITNSVNSFLTV